MSESIDPAELMSVTAHELRSPLAALVLRLASARRAVSERELGDNVGASLQTCERLVRRLEHLIDGMHDAARFAQDRLELQLGTHDLAEIAAGCAGEVSCDVVTELEPVAGAWDGRRLRHIVAHILATAQKYRGDSAVEMSVFAEAGAARLSIRTCGVPFALERESARADFALFVARRLIAAHGGSFEIAADGARTRFEVSLPRSNP